MLIIGGSGSGETNALLNLIREQDSDELIYAEDLNKPKYHLLSKQSKEAGTHVDKPYPKAFIEFSNAMDDVYNNINDKNKK